MNRSKNDHIIEMAKKFIDNCNSFEIKDLDADKQYLNNLPAITPFTDRIKEYLNSFEEEQNQNLTKTSSNDLDELCIFEKDMFATVYKGNIIKNLIMDCQSYTKYRPNETTGGIFVSWRRKEELPTGA